MKNKIKEFRFKRNHILDAVDCCINIKGIEYDWKPIRLLRKIMIEKEYKNERETLKYILKKMKKYKIQVSLEFYLFVKSLNILTVKNNLTNEIPNLDCFDLDRLLKNDIYKDEKIVFKYGDPLELIKIKKTKNFNKLFDKNLDKLFNSKSFEYIFSNSGSFKLNKKMINILYNYIKNIDEYEVWMPKFLYFVPLSIKNTKKLMFIIDKINKLS